MRFKKKLLEDIEATISSTKLNAPHSKGYLFCTNKNKDAIDVGMYCDWEDEKDPEIWEYFVDFKKNNKIVKLEKGGNKN